MSTPVENDSVRNKTHDETEKSPVHVAYGPGKQDQIDLVYDHAKEEPKLRSRTYFALAAMLLLNFVQVFGLQGPPAALDTIGADLHASNGQTWIPNALVLVTAVLSPTISSASDIFAARKFILVTGCLISFVGSAIAAGSQSLSRLIVAQILIGFGLALVPLAYAVPSEILPRKWRPLCQSSMNVAAQLGACSAILSIGALTRAEPKSGWRKFYWIQMALWGLTAAGILMGYKPAKRHTAHDNLTVVQKIRQLDIVGFSLLTAGLTLFLVGLNLGGVYRWQSAPVIATIVVGLLTILTFGGWEWRGATHPMLTRAMFKGGEEAGRSFAILLGLVFTEGILVFSFIRERTGTLFTSDVFLVATRELAFWLVTAASTIIWGWLAQRMNSIRLPMGLSFAVMTAGTATMASIQPGQSASSIGFAAVMGFGFGGPLILIVAGVQLATPRHYIASATAITTSSRAVAATVFTAIFAASYGSRLTKKLPDYVAAAAISGGLPPRSVEPFVQAFLANDTMAISQISGVSPSILKAAASAVPHAYADSVRLVFIIAAPFGVVAMVGCFFLGTLGESMTYVVDHPIEKLEAKHAAEQDG